MADINKIMNVDISNLDKLLGIDKSSLSSFMGLILSTSYGDFCDYTEVDENGDLTIDPCTVITADTVLRNALAYVRKDFGAGHFKNFTLEFEIDSDAPDSGSSAQLLVAAFTNQSDSYSINQISANQDGFGCVLVNLSTVAQNKIQRYEGSNDKDTQNLTKAHYYYTMQKDGDTGTLKIYTDSDRTNIVADLSISGLATSYRYLGAICSPDSDVYPTQYMSMVVSNFNFTSLESE